MSAGTSCNVKGITCLLFNNPKVKFLPQVNEEIDTSIRIITENGIFELPLVCATKKVQYEDFITPQCIINSDTSAIDFGRLFLGQVREKKLTLVNSGALPTEFVAEIESISTDVSFTKSGKIEGYSSVTIPVSFEPTREGDFQNSLKFSFSEVS